MGTDALLGLEKAKSQLKAGDKWQAVMSMAEALTAKLEQLYAKQFFAGGETDWSHQVPAPAYANNALVEAGVYSQLTHRKIDGWLKLWSAAGQQLQVKESDKEVAAVLAAVRLFFATVKDPIPLPEASHSLRRIQAILAEPNLSDMDKVDRIRAEVITPGRTAPETPVARRVLRDLSALLPEKPAGESGLFIV